MDTATPITGFFMPLVLLRNIAVQILDKEGNYESILAWIIISCIVIYIIALIFSKKSSCIIVYGWKDFALLASPLVIIAFIVLYNTFYGKDNGKIIEANNIFANIIFMLPIIATFSISIVSNTRHSNMPGAVFFTIISIAGKIVLMIVMVVFIILCIGILGAYQEKGRKKDNRYKSGYRPGKSNMVFVVIAMAILGFLASFFIKSLVKSPNATGNPANDNRGDEEKDQIQKRKNNKPASSHIEDNRMWLAILLFSIILGMFGVHRFYTRKIFTGILMLLTMGGMGIWWLIDIILVLSGSFKDKDGNYIRREK
jgi:TM2 domain-containing membrane protein YozV